jgi:hypothetical protein
VVVVVVVDYLVVVPVLVRVDPDVDKKKENLFKKSELASSSVY